MEQEFLRLCDISHVFPTYHTVVKCTDPVETRKHIEHSQPVKSASVEPKFLDRHLSVIPYGVNWKESVDHALLNESNKPRPKHGEKTYYAPFAQFLTKISNYLFERIPNREASVRVIEFIPNGNKPLTGHPGDEWPTSEKTYSKYAPDVVAVDGRSSDFLILGDEDDESEEDTTDLPDAVASLSATTSSSGAVSDAAVEDLLRRSSTRSLSTHTSETDTFPELPMPLAPDPSTQEDSPLTHDDATQPTDTVNAIPQEGAPNPAPLDDSEDPPTPKYHAVPYQKVRALIEMKNEKNNGLYQAISYTWYTLEACPNVNGVYALSARPQSYQLIWSDASGPIVSPEYKWTNLEPLARWLYSLYVSPPGHHHFDRTLTPWDESPLLWDIKTCGRTYDRCELTHWIDGWGRRTKVFKHVDDNGDKTIIKDAYRDEARRFKEKDVLKTIHQDGTMPGVVRVIDTEDVPVHPHDSAPSDAIGKDGAATPPVLTTPGVGTRSHRTKNRLVLGSFGQRLVQARSLLDLLKAIYDVVEVHRALVRERKVLHRDMSANNILMYPEHHSDVTSGEAVTFKTPVKFIDDVLPPSAAASTNAHSDAKKDADRARCLLIDFDNSAIGKSKPPTHAAETGEGPSSAGEVTMSNNTFSSKELAQRTGTASFIARSVALGRTLTKRSVFKFVAMPDLDEEARELYVRAYGEDVYNQFSDTRTTCHLGVPPAPPPLPQSVKRDDVAAPVEPAAPVIPFTHRPCHDVESIYWTFFSAMIQVRPVGSNIISSEGEDRFHQFYKMLAEHTISDDPQTKDSRNDILHCYNDETLDEALHIGLQGIGLGKLLFDLGKQTGPEYALLQPNPPAEHLHEAFRRLLLEYIARIGDKDIPLDPEQLRIPPQVHVPPPQTTKKRGSAVLDEDGGAAQGASKRHKVRLGMNPPMSASRGGQQMRHVSYNRASSSFHENASGSRNSKSVPPDSDP